MQRSREWLWDGFYRTFILLDRNDKEWTDKKGGNVERKNLRLKIASSVSKYNREGPVI